MTSARKEWDSPLFWIATACFICVVGRPLLMLTIHAVLVLAPTLGDLGNGVTWTATLGLPLVCFAALLATGTRALEKPIAWADCRPFRILLLVVATAIVVAGRVFDSGIVASSLFSTAEKSEAAAWAGMALSTLAIAGPISFAALAFGLRTATPSPTSATAKGKQVLWLGLGCLLGIVTTDIGEFTWMAAVFAGAGLSPRSLRLLVWIVTLATPLACLVAAHAWMRHRSLGPAVVVGAPRFGTAVLVIATVAVTCVVVLGSVSIGGPAIAAFDAARETRALAGIIAGTFVPLAAGSMMLRLRHLAAFGKEATP